MIELEKAFEMAYNNEINALDVTILMQAQWILALSENPLLLPEYEKYLNSEYTTLDALGFKRDETQASYVKWFMQLARDSLKGINAENN